MTETLISIIVPVYNVEKYLDRCIQSIIGQTYQQIEILLIDDGSTDVSGSICDNYAQIDNRIKVVHQQNQGASLSRKTAIELSKGEYVLFVDSDDWIEQSMVERLVSKAVEDNLEIVWCDVMLQLEEGIRVSRIAYDSNPSIMLDLLFRGIIPGWFCNKLIRSYIVKKLEFPKDSMMEDVYLSTQVFLENPRMGYVAEPFYNYNRINQNALTYKSNCIIESIPNLVNCYNYISKKQKLELFKASLSILILKVKIALLNDKQFCRAQDILPFAHKKLTLYPTKFPLSIIYWVALNCKYFGPLIFSIYNGIRKKCVY